MTRRGGLGWAFCAVLFVFIFWPASCAEAQMSDAELLTDPFEEQPSPDQHHRALSDPFYKFNRKSTRFNDRFYFKVLKPAALGYKSAFPLIFRKSIRNFFHNLQEPVYFVNAILQGKPNDAGAALTRLVVNSTAGIGGLADPVRKRSDTMRRTFDQTFAKWGIAPGPYIVWPLIGSSSIRGTFGLAAEEAMDPFNYAGAGAGAGAAVLETVNEASYQIGAYEDIKKYSVNTYAALKDIYEKKISNKAKE